MAKRKTQFVCQGCGAAYPRWLGKCEACGEWNTLVEEALSTAKTATNQKKDPVGNAPKPLADISHAPLPRVKCGIEELDRVLGGGLVQASTILFGGDPGVGKSTLLLQAAGSLAAQGKGVLYLSAEEAPTQIRLRAERINMKSTDLLVDGQSDLDFAIGWANKLKPALVIVDSIQTFRYEGLESAPGTVTQVREVATRWAHWAKESGSTVALVGHVTKEGSIAGPRTIEHLVDAVMMFEGDHVGGVRVLRSLKNRFGATGELGVFEMGDKGLNGVKDPSRLFLSERGDPVSGVAVAPVIRGSRPLLIEVQALVSRSYFAAPQRNATGIDPRRLALWVAVLEKRVGLALVGQDIFINATGGVKLEDAGADLAAAAAINSSLRDHPINPKTVMIGEVGLTGEIRAVNNLERRLNEAYHLAFTKAIIPAAGWKGGGPKGMNIVPVKSLEEAIDASVD